MNDYHSIAEYIEKEKGIKSDFGNNFYMKTLRPAQPPKWEYKLEYINNHIGEFIKWVEEYYNIEIPQCNKRPLSEEDSKKALAMCLLSINLERREKRRYYCEQCDAWHLTSQPNKNKTKIRI